MNKLMALEPVANSAAVFSKHPAQLCGGSPAQTAQNTTKFLRSNQGKVVIIEDGLQDVSEQSRNAIVNVMVAELRRMPKNDQCFLLICSKKGTRKLAETSPRLFEVFPRGCAIVVDSFSDVELHAAVETVIKKHNLTATPEALDAAMA